MGVLIPASLFDLLSCRLSTLHMSIIYTLFQLITCFSSVHSLWPQFDSSSVVVLFCYMGPKIVTCKTDCTFKLVSLWKIWSTHRNNEPYPWDWIAHPSWGLGFEWPLPWKENHFGSPETLNGWVDIVTLLLNAFFATGCEFFLHSIDICSHWLLVWEGLFTTHVMTVMEVCTAENMVILLKIKAGESATLVKVAGLQ